jgi:hypothetical protein
LEDPAQRDRAACRLIELGLYRSQPRYRETACEQVPGAVNHVVAVHQESGPSMYAVFRRPDYDVPEAGPGLPKGPFTLFDGDGYIVPVFSGANLIEADGDLFAYAGDTRLAIAHLISHGGTSNGPTDWTALVLHIVPITPNQRSVLSVVVGPPTYGIDDTCNGGVYWGWRHADRDGDGIREIEIGPLQNREGDIIPRAVYRWSVPSEQYEGPTGSVEDGFVRVDTQPQDGACCPFYGAIERFALARRQLPTPGDPSAVRRSRCHSVSFTGGFRQE